MTCLYNLTTRLAWPISAVFFLSISIACGFQVLQTQLIPLTGLLPAEIILDFGECKQTDVLSKTIVLTNYCAVPVRIIEIGKGCSCAKTEIAQKEIEPGGQAELKVEWHIGTRRGACEEPINVLYNIGDGHQEILKIVLRTTVRPDIEFKPNSLTFEGSQAESQTIQFGPGLLDVVEISETSINHKAFQVAILPDQRSVTVAFDPAVSGSGGPGLCLRVKTNSSRESIIVIPVLVRNPRKNSGMTIPVMMPSRNVP